MIFQVKTDCSSTTQRGTSPEQTVKNCAKINANEKSYQRTKLNKTMVWTSGRGEETFGGQEKNPWSQEHVAIGNDHCLRPSVPHIEIVCERKLAHGRPAYTLEAGEINNNLCVGNTIDWIAQMQIQLATKIPTPPPM